MSNHFFKHKYGAKRCESDGIKFPSKLERAVYEKLKELQKEGVVLFFLRQISFDLPGKKKHAVDFCVFLKENVIFIEAKGRDLEAGRLRRSWVEERYPVKIHVAKSAKEAEAIVREFS